MWLGRNVKIRMMPRALARWQNFTSDDKAVLEYAFHDAITNPHLVPSHKSWIVRLRAIGQLVEVHKLRIGDANFLIIETLDAEFVWDLWLDPAIAVAAE